MIVIIIIIIVVVEVLLMYIRIKLLTFIVIMNPAHCQQKPYVILLLFKTSIC